MKKVLTALLVFSLTVAVVAFAQLNTRRVGVDWQRGVPRIHVGIQDLADTRVQQALQSGLRKRIVITAQAFDASNDRLITSRNFQCAVTYDLWQESFAVEIGSRVERFETLEAVVERCLDIKGMPVGRGEDYASRSGGRVYFAVRAAFDPIDRRRCRTLLRSSGASADPIGPFVINIVRRDICSADRVVEFRSQSVRVP